jgi:pimeloyl-ACP methyl ester carboxylesterase
MGESEVIFNFMDSPFMPSPILAIRFAVCLLVTPVIPASAASGQPAPAGLQRFSDQCALAPMGFTADGQHLWAYKNPSTPEQKRATLALLDRKGALLLSVDGVDNFSSPMEPTDTIVAQFPDQQRLKIARLQAGVPLQVTLDEVDIKKITNSDDEEDFYITDNYDKDGFTLRSLNKTNHRFYVSTNNLLIKKIANSDNWEEKFAGFTQSGFTFYQFDKQKATMQLTFHGQDGKGKPQKIAAPLEDINSSISFDFSGPLPGLLTLQRPAAGGSMLVLHSLAKPEATPFWSVAEGDINHVIRAPGDNRLIGFIHGYGLPRLALLQGDQAGLDRHLAEWADGAPFGLLSVVAVGPEGRELLLRATTTLGKTGYLLVRIADGDVRELSSLPCQTLPAIKVELHQASARDGLKLPYYRFTRSPSDGAVTNPVPIVVYIHGGPNHRVRLDDPFPQFLADQGWEVIAPEYRGNTGYGGPLFQAGRGALGPVLAEDVEDVLASLGAEGRPIILFGSSLGGRIALEMLNRQPDRYKGAFLSVAAADIDQSLGQQRRQGLATNHGFSGPWDGPAGRWQPGEHPFKGRVFMFHGTEDGRTPVEQIVKAAQDMTTAGWASCLTIVPGMRHDVTTLEAKQKFTEAFAQFRALLEKPDGPTPCGSPPSLTTLEELRAAGKRVPLRLERNP